MMNNNSQAGKTLFKSSVWTISTRLSIRFLGVISIIILARILTAEDYGIVAKAVMILAVLELISMLGLETALVSDPEATPDHYNTVWTLQICRGIIIGGILALLAVPASVYFKEPALDKIIYCYASFSALEGFYNIGVVDFRKNFNFNLDFQYNLYKKIFPFITTITVAIIWKTYWALVAGVAVATFTEIISSYIMSSYRPKFSLKKWRDLFHFSKWMTLHTIMASITFEVDKFILARFSPANILGLYLVSNELAKTPTAELAMSVSRASTPSMAKLKNDISKLKELYQKSLSMMTLISAPTGVGISVLSLEFTSVILGDKWLDAAPLIEVIAITGIFTLFTSNSIPSLITAGKVKALSLLSTFAFFLRSSLIIAGYMYGGIMGLVEAALFSMILYVFISLGVQQYFKIFNFKDMFKVTWRILVASLLMYLGLDAFKDYFYSTFEFNKFINTFIFIIFGMLIYGLSLITLWMASGKSEGPEYDIVTLLLKRKND